MLAGSLSVVPLSAGICCAPTFGDEVAPDFVGARRGFLIGGKGEVGVCVLPMGSQQ